MNIRVFEHVYPDGLVIVAKAGPRGLYRLVAYSNATMLCDWDVVGGNEDGWEDPARARIKLNQEGWLS